MSEFRLAALLCSRLCHDVIGPIGAINNGLEILSDDNDATLREQTLDLIAFSAAEASTRVQFYRWAFGSAGSVAPTLDAAKRIMRAMVEAGKIELDWPDDGPEMGMTHLQLLLNIIVLASEALPRGGSIAVRPTVIDEGFRIRVVAAGRNAGLADAFELALGGEVEGRELDARTVQAHLTAHLAIDLGGEVGLVAADAGQVAIEARVPAVAP